eukprot:2591256-Pyramimonas_sp.AAC.1
MGDNQQAAQVQLTVARSIVQSKLQESMGLFSHGRGERARGGPTGKQWAGNVVHDPPDPRRAPTPTSRGG